jgi:hypothetical protein
MKNLGLAVLALATVLATAPAAMAAPTVPIYVDIWGTSTSDPTGTSGVGVIALGSGTLQGISEGGGLYDITGGSLAINGPVGWTGTGTVIANGNWAGTSLSGGGAFAYDDALNLSSGPNYVDFHGLLLQLPGNVQAAIYLDSNGEIAYNDVIEFYNTATHTYNSAVYDGYDVGLSASLTPEPSSWLLMGTGLLFLVGFLYRKAKPGLNRAA